MKAQFQLKSRELHHAQAVRPGLAPLQVGLRCSGGGGGGTAPPAAVEGARSSAPMQALSPLRIPAPHHRNHPPPSPHHTPSTPSPSSASRWRQQGSRAAAAGPPPCSGGGGGGGSQCERDEHQCGRHDQAMRAGGLPAPHPPTPQPGAVYSLLPLPPRQADELGVSAARHRPPRRLQGRAGQGRAGIGSARRVKAGRCSPWGCPGRRIDTRLWSIRESSLHPLSYHTPTHSIHASITAAAVWR